MVSLVKVAVAFWALTMPPPLSTAELPEIVSFVNVSDPVLAIPPPESAAEFPSTVQLLRVSAPALSMPPPSDALPSVMVSPIKSARAP